MPETLEKRVDRLERVCLRLLKIVALVGGMTDEQWDEIAREVGLDPASFRPMGS